MGIVTLLLRDMRNGQRMTAEFETLDSCRDWLTARPQFIDVLGPVNEDLSPEGDRLLRTALRPFDAEERELLGQNQAQQQAETTKARAVMSVQLNASRDAERERVAKLGPNDPMTVAWERGGRVVNTEPLDPRPVPPVVVEAMTAWVAERNSWIAGRGQSVSAAHVTVWPGEVPAGQERIFVGGQFEVG